MSKRTPQVDLRVATHIPFRWIIRERRERFAEVRAALAAWWECMKWGHDVPTVEESVRSGSGLYCRRCGLDFGGEQSVGG